ncbi:viroplasmin family protein [Clostridium sp. WILCCON 0269]|uniref:ribonuclease H n=1 Tax=Candidatus Clostridium eludens TaxID=3381663 RepID=A0ABW8SSA3_9CLOT
MANFYAVKAGRKPGVYNTWAQCEEQIKGFSGAKYKKFTDRKEAEIFAGLLEDKNNDSENMYDENITPECDTLYAYVDGSFNNEENVAGYGLVLVQNDQVIFKDLGAFRSMEMNESKNVFGEIRGALKAVELALANDFKEITIVYDYMGIECWAKGEWKANKVLTKDYKEFMQKYMKKINISFKKVKAHSGEDKYNDMADFLAKKAVGIKD